MTYSFAVKKLNIGSGSILLLASRKDDNIGGFDFQKTGGLSIRD
jgi:hypothetical protein